MEEKIITVEKLREKLNDHESVFILDVRATDLKRKAIRFFLEPNFLE